MYKRSVSNRLISQIDMLNNYKQRCKAAEEEKKSLEKMEQQVEYLKKLRIRTWY